MIVVIKCPHCKKDIEDNNKIFPNSNPYLEEGIYSIQCDKCQKWVGVRVSVA